MRRMVVTAGLIFGLTHAAAQGQAASDSGARVRVTFRSAVERAGHVERIITTRVDGTLVGGDAGNAIVLTTGNQRIVTPRADVERFAGMERFGFFKGAGIGSLIGIGVGVGMSIAAPHNQCDGLCAQPLYGAELGALAGSLGAIVGGVIGFNERVPVWTPLVGEGPATRKRQRWKSHVGRPSTWHSASPWLEFGPCRSPNRTGPNRS